MLVNVAVCHRRIPSSPFSLLAFLFSNFSLHHRVVLSHCLCFPGKKKQRNGRKTQPQAITVAINNNTLLSAVSIAIVFWKRISRGLRVRLDTVDSFISVLLCLLGLTRPPLRAVVFTLFERGWIAGRKRSGRKLSIKIRRPIGNCVTRKPL